MGNPAGVRKIKREKRRKKLEKRLLEKEIAANPAPVVAAKSTPRKPTGTSGLSFSSEVRFRIEFGSCEFPSQPFLDG